MKIIRAKDYQDMSRKAANIISAQVIMKPDCVLGLATGGTPVPMYKKLIEANKAGKPFLVEAPMENIVVPTPGCWNINDIYSPNELVKEGKLVKKENGQYVAPSHSKSHNAK